MAFSLIFFCIVCRISVTFSSNLQRFRLKQTELNQILQLGGILARSCLQFNVTLSDITYWLTPQSGFLCTVLIVCVCSIFLLSFFCSDAHDWAISRAESNHRERRTFLRQELSRMVLFFSDQPSLIAPNIQVGSYTP